MQGSFFAAVLLVIVLLFSSLTPAVCEEAATLQDQYKQAKFFYKQLESSKDLGQQRELWLKSGRNFRRVYLNNPKSELAPASLYMLGMIYREMFTRFKNKEDLEEAVGYFKDCLRLFPHHRLADDALLMLGEISLDESKDAEAAAGYYRDILTNYPMGDMHPEASERLKSLSSQYNIALPKQMLDGLHHTKLTNVLPVKYWSSADYSRVIIKASGAVTYSAQLLEKNDDKPRRLFIDFQNSYIEPRYRAPVPIADGLLQQIRTGQYSDDTVRVVLDMESVSSYKIFSLPDPFRVVVDIRGEKTAVIADNSKHLNSIGQPKLGDTSIVILRKSSKHKVGEPSSPQRTSEEEITDNRQVDDGTDLTLAQQLGLGVRKIVIDPGHGGKDPGAIGNGLKEKDIVLKLAKKLAADLSANNAFEVVLTRNDDSYISLEERTAIANGNNADLFVSLHINAHASQSVHGTQTYYLNLTSNPEAMRVAAYENATSELQMSDLQDVLASIMKNSKIQESARLAQNIHSSLLKGLARENYVLKDLGVKQAPFYVLIGAEMPAVLLELAFISNDSDADKLKDDTFLDDSAAIISNGILSYIHSNSARLSTSP